MEKQGNRGFVFYESFVQCADTLPDEKTRNALINAIINYGIYEETPTFAEVESNIRPFLKSAFVQIRILLDGAKTRYNASVTNGKKGGAPKGNKNAVKDKREPRQTTPPTESKREQPKAQEQPQSEAKPITPTPPPPTTPSRAQDLNKRMAQFVREVAEYRIKYTDSLLNAFASYWSEPNQAKTKMRFEMEKTWDTGRRLATWAKRENEFNGGDIAPELRQDQRRRAQEERLAVRIRQLAEEDGGESYMQRQERERAERLQSAKELMQRLSLEDEGEEIKPY